MEDARILESERYQMEQIRQLESEELQVEEVDEQSSDEDETNYRSSGGASASGEFTYDTSLAALHSYLGDVEDTHNRLAFLDGGAVLTVPLFYLEGVVLFPEATLPLRVIQPNFIASVDRALRQVDAPYTIGVIRVYRDPNNGRIKLATTGTTAEIRQYRHLEDGSVNIVTRGQQRFRLRRRWMDVEESRCGEIQIIKEDLPLKTPREAVGRSTPLSIFRSGVHIQVPPVNRSRADQYDFGNENDSDAMSEESFESELSPTERRLHQSALVSCDMFDDSTSSDDENIKQQSRIQPARYPLDNFRSSFGTGENKEADGVRFALGKRSMATHNTWKKCSLNQFRQVPRAFWPSWVYQMYDSYSLAQRAAGRWKQIVRAPSMDSYVTKPDLLSFHIASKMPVSESTRQELLEIDGISYRLRREIELLESFDCVRCRPCETLIARRSDMLVMSSEGPLGAYVNPHGFVHEIMTLFKANGLAVIGNPVKEYSWFPGYAWSIAECATCETQLGWLFTATKKKLKPRSFWGIRSSQVVDDSR
ncbi:hypothetical protein K7X08_013869 [Anisodus acutangulus]|uniref:Protein cereblon n=1 Tax=Anisodus acutangulus TaxID=402998 RepID=A0A9Q1R3S6_9SOLA|nr:hypothetical protein K7X08_013869 [Anisodus acutangulus]